jgi:hypothetical protein
MNTLSYKNIIGCALLGSALSLSSCLDLSDRPYDDIAAEDYTFTDDDIQSMFSSVYSNLRNVYWGWNGYFDAMEESADLLMTPLRIGVGWGDLYITMHKHTYHSRIGHFSTIWNSAYAGINACNKLLEQDLVKASGMSVAQLRAYRALYYYLLFEMFRNLPLETVYTVPEGYQPEQSSPQEIFNFMESELNDVKETLGSLNEYGKINEATCRMILAKMYLNYNAWFETNDITYYQKAYEQAEDIIRSGEYALSPNYSDPFKADLSQCSEVIFALPSDNNYARANYCVNKCFHGASGATFGYTGTPWNGSCAVPQFLDTYDEDDSRFEATWLIGVQYDLQGNVIMVGDEPLDYTQFVNSIDNPGAYPMQGARFRKFEVLPGTVGTYADDQQLFRLTDTYMIKAECLLRLGGYKDETEQTAADIVSMLRERAFRNNPQKAVRTVAQLKGGSCYRYGLAETQVDANGNEVFVGTDEGGDDIEWGGFLDDLAWEFVGEHHRRQDLIRFRLTGKNMNVYNGKSWFCKKAETDPGDTHKNIYPIYQNFLDGNPKLKQNPGY